METFLLYLVIAVALGFDFVNGFHDAANSIATVVATRVLKPRVAVAWAAAFNFIAFLIFGTKVATTIAKDVVQPSVQSIGVIFAALVGAITGTSSRGFLGSPVVVVARVGRWHGPARARAKAGGHVLIGSGLRRSACSSCYSPLIGLALGLHGRRCW